MREEREVLEHQPDPALLRRHEAIGSRDLLAVEEDPPRGWTLDACGDPKQGRLAAARRPEQAEDLRRRDIEADAVERQRLAITARHLFQGEPCREGDRRLAATGTSCRSAVAAIGAARARLQKSQHSADLRTWRGKGNRPGGAWAPYGLAQANITHRVLKRSPAAHRD